MQAGRRSAHQALVKLFQAIGRASLREDIQDSHSGNMALKLEGNDGRPLMAVTATGSQKGDLRASDIRFLPMTGAGFQAQGASRESLVHAQILKLKAVRASLHVHAKDLMIMTLDDEHRPAAPQAFVPLDPLGFFHLKGTVPVEWVEVPSGSKEMAAVLSSRLAASPAVVIQAHGAFTRGRTLEEAFFHACLANNAGYVVRLLEKLKRNVDRLRAKARARPESFFDLRLSAYDSSSGLIFGQVRGEVRAEFAATGARFFESRLSPFHTGSASVRAGSSMIFAPQVSRPRDLPGPLLKLPLGAGEENGFEARRHKALYAAHDFQALLHCYLPEAEALARGADPTAGGPAESLRPIDAEGRYLYPMVPVVPPGVETEELGRLLQEYKMVVVRGGGVWAAGYRDLAEALHHPSSLRDICLYRIGAFERGLNLKRLESF